MRDNEKIKADEVIKALNGADGLEHICIYCADNNGEDVCTIKLIDIIDLINRLQAENERLRGYASIPSGEEDEDWYTMPQLKTPEEIKTEAIKEFAKKLKLFLHTTTIPIGDYLIVARCIDNLVKEMTEVSK